MKYPSRYSNGKQVTISQYITELICENKAKYDKEDLGYRFWTNPKWSKFYRDQIATANKLVKKYNGNAIIKALKNQKANKIYSLRAPGLIKLIEHEQDLIDKTNKDLSKNYDRSENKKFNTKNNKASKLSKLKELE